MLEAAIDLGAERLLQCRETSNNTTRVINQSIMIYKTCWVLRSKLGLEHGEFGLLVHAVDETYPVSETDLAVEEPFRVVCNGDLIVFVDDEA